MDNSNIFKKLIVNSLVNSLDLQDEINSYLFYDAEESEARNKTKIIKNKMINEFNLNLQFQRGPCNDWHVSYRRNKWIKGGQNCKRCGQFYWTNELCEEEVPDIIACKC
jgi:hypothetical protein